MSVLPIGLVLFIGRLMGRLAYALDSRHRKTALSNLDMAFGSAMSPTDREDTARAAFENMGMTALEALRIPWLKPRGLDGYVRFDGISNLESALSRGRGVIFYTAHFGNWELMAAAMALRGYSGSIVARPLDAEVFERFVLWVRTSTGNSVVGKRWAMRGLMQTLADNGMIAVLMDQNVTRKEGVFVDFFGAPACTNKGLALLAQKTGAVVLPIFMLREGRTHRVIIEREVCLSSTGDKEADVMENTARFTKRIEDMIRRHPGQWFWVHRRWKTRPEA